MVVLDQRRSALARANDAREDIKAYKRSVGCLSRADSQIEAARVLLAEPELVASMRVHEFLGAIFGYRDSHVRKVLHPLGVWPLKRCRDLSTRQRVSIAGALSHAVENARSPTPTSTNPTSTE